MDLCFVFFFQAEDGIRDLYVTGVQTCALPIWARVATARKGEVDLASGAVSSGRVHIGPGPDASQPDILAQLEVRVVAVGRDLDLCNRLISVPVRKGRTRPQHRSDDSYRGRQHTQQKCSPHQRLLSLDCVRDRAPQSPTTSPLSAT